MFEIQKIESTIKPDKFESLNNGVWYYNYDVTERTELVSENMSKGGELVERTLYSYVQVRIQGEPTVNKCWEAILKAYKNETGTSLYAYNSSPSKDKDSTALSDEVYFNVEVDFGLVEPLTEVEIAASKVIKKIEDYDTSEAVNSFYLNGLQVWLNKDTRVGLMNSLTIESDKGREDSTLWFGNVCLTVNCAAAIEMLRNLEIYALACYNKTAEHKANVSALSDLNEIMNYDYTDGYPEKLSFAI